MQLLLIAIWLTAVKFPLSEGVRTERREVARPRRPCIQPQYEPRFTTRMDCHEGLGARLRPGAQSSNISSADGVFNFRGIQGSFQLEAHLDAIRNFPLGFGYP